LQRRFDKSHLNQVSRPVGQKFMAVSSKFLLIGSHNLQAVRRHLPNIFNANVELEKAFHLVQQAMIKFPFLLQGTERNFIQVADVAPISQL